MKRSQPVSRSALLAAALAFSLAAPRAAAAQSATVAPLASHHATYKLSLLKSTGANALASAQGVIDYDFSGSPCEGYTTNFRQITEVQPAEGDARVNDMHSTTFEDGAAEQFTFDTKTTTDKQTVSDLDGRAQKGPDGRMSVDLRRPPGSMKLPGEVLFPTEHLRRIIATAEAGGHLLSASVYDGSDTGKKVFRTLSVIGAPAAGLPDDAAGKNDALKEIRRWPVAISYFENEAADKPDYTLSFDLYENGISRALKLDYGDFVLSGDLTDVRLLPSKACAPR